MGLYPKVLIVGPRNRANALRILNRELIGGGNTNIHYQEMDLLVLPQIDTYCPWAWFVADDEYGKPLLYDLREGPRTAAQTADDADEVFERERYRFKAAIKYVLLISNPWLIQAVYWTADSTTTARS